MMDVKKAGSPVAVKLQHHNENQMAIRKGPWTVDEDTILVNYIATHGEGQWNSLARCAGLRRSGKSCRLRWLNYLRPDVRRGNMTAEEQILILDLQCRWGNRWSKIAKHLPGRTDNEIKNYWRTRVIKQAKQLKYDVNSKQFRDTLRYVWMPRLLERLQPTSQTQHPNQSRVGGFTFLHHQNGGSDSGTEWAKPNHSYSDSSSVVPANSGQSDSSAHHVSDHNSIEKGPDLWPGFNNQVLLEQGSGGVESLESLWGDESMWFLQQLFDDSK